MKWNLKNNIIAIIGCLLILAFKNEIFAPNKFARFEVQIEKENKEKIKGFLITEEMIGTFDNSEFQNWILSNHGDFTKGNSIWLCTEQYFFKHPEPNSNFFSCCTETVKVQKEEILEIEKLAIIKDVFQSNEREITEKEKVLFQKEPFSKFKFYIEGEVIHDSGGDYFIDYWLLSYNQKIGEKKLEEIRNRITNEYLKSKEGAKWNEVYENWNKIYLKHRKELIKQDVIFLEIGGM